MPDPDLTKLVGLAPLVGAITVDAIEISTHTADDTPGVWATEFVNRADHLHDLMFTPSATQEHLNSQCANFASLLIAYIIVNGGHTV